MYEGRIFIDGSYEGDLIAAAQVPYRIGAESRDEYG
ncbi:MAG: FAD-dependent oxidoreductase [Opitutaceae bacterium]